MTGRDCKHVATLLAARRAGLSTADRLRVEEHLSTCTDCAEEARLEESLVALMDAAPNPLSGAQRAEAIFRALSAASPSERPARTMRLSRSAMGVAMGAAVLAAAGVLLAVVLGNPFAKAPATVALSPQQAAGEEAAELALDQITFGNAMVDGVSIGAGQVIPADKTITITQPADLRVAHANLHAEAGTSLRWRDADRTVELLSGAVMAKVDPGPHERFAVQTMDFRVVVTGTQFRVTPESVSVTEGSVRVERLSGAVLQASVTAGQQFSWQRPQVDLRPPAESPAEDPTESAGDSAPTGEQLSAAKLLDRARGALSQGQVKKAENLVRRALAQHPGAAERAEALTLQADSAAMAGRLGTAVKRYLAVASQFPHAAAGQNALYAAARLEQDRGRADAARGLLLRYLAKYPQGRFVRDAKRLLTQVSDAATTPTR